MHPILRSRPLLASGLAYVAITAMIGRQILAAMGTSIASDPGDPLLTAAILAWNATQLPWTDAWYQFPIFWPTPDTLVLSEHLLGVSVIAAPIQWLTGSPVIAYNATLLLSYPLCGLSMYLLVWHLTRNAGAAFLAGLAYAFAPYRTSHLPHIQMLVSFWMPLSLLGLHAFLESRRWPWLAVFAVTWMLQGASNGYYLVYFTFVVVLWVAWFMVTRRRWRDAGAVAIALLVAAVPLAPILYRYLTVQRALGLSRGIGEISVFSADIAAPLCAPSGLTFWGWLRVACDVEGELFAGAALIALCLASAIGWGRSGSRPVGAWDPPSPATGADPPSIPPRRWRVVAMRLALAAAGVYAAVTLWTLVAGPWRVDFPWRASASSADKPASVTLFLLLVALLLSPWLHHVIRRGSTATFYLLCAAVCWVLTWGPFPRLFGETVLYQAPYAWLLPFPGTGALRAPARLWMMVVFCVIVFMGLAVARLLSASSRRTARLVVIGAALGLAADGWTTIRAAIVPPAPATDLAGRVVLFLPAGDVFGDIASVYHAVTRTYRAVNGYSGYEPPYYEALRTLSDAGDDRLFAPFVTRGDVDVLVKNDDRVLRTLVERQPGQHLVAEGAVAHYRVPSRAVPPPSRSPAGERIPIRRAHSACSPERIGSPTDGNLQTAWVCGIQEPVQDITFDLGGVAQVGAIVHALGSAGAFFPRHLRIETSTDDAMWTEAWDGSPAAAALQAALVSPREARVVIEFRARPARYVRLRQLAREGTHIWSIAELEVWGTP